MLISSTTNLFFSPYNDVSPSLSEAVARCSKAGFEALDLNLSRSSFFSGDWKRQLAEALKTAQKFGLSFLYAHVPYSYPADNDEQGWQFFNRSVFQAIEACAFAGVKYAAIHPHCFAVPNFDLQAAKAHSIEHLSPFIDKADNLGVCLAIENMRGPRAGEAMHRYCSTAEELADLVDYFGGRAGACWDTGHANIAGLDQGAALKKLGSRLKMLHVNDNYGVDDEHIAPFTGTADWSVVMSALKDIKFEGSLNYEVGSRRMPHEIRPAFAQFLLQAGRELCKLGSA